MPRRLVAAAAVLALAAAGHAATGRAPAPGRSVHVVGRGETLSGLAARFDVSVAALARANGIGDIHKIRAGQRLTVPAAGGAAATASTASLPDRLRERPERLAFVPTFDAAARRHDVPADLLKALTWLESGWQNDKVSSVGAVGIGQLMPATVAFVNDILLRADLDPTRPEDNIELSARFLGYLLAQTRRESTALASYYQGLASVRRHGPGRATERYVADVLALRRKF